MGQLIWDAFMIVFNVYLIQVEKYGFWKKVWIVFLIYWIAFLIIDTITLLFGGK